MASFSLVVSPVNSMLLPYGDLGVVVVEIILIGGRLSSTGKCSQSRSWGSFGGGSMGFMLVFSIGSIDGLFLLW